MFESIHGQDTAVKAMTHALTRPVNTYAFIGSRGTNIEESARIFASRLIDASGEHDQRVAARIHPDVIEYEPVGTAYRIKEDVRDGMLAEHRKSPVMASAKVLIVHDAHLMRADSANAMLKSLEEPPAHVFWIVIAPSRDELLSTIVSRSYVIDFVRLTPEIIEQQLITEGVDAHKAHQVSTECAGRLDRARLLATDFFPVRSCAHDVVASLTGDGSSCARNARLVVETFDEITSDVAAHNKSALDELKKTVKDSGHSDTIAKGIISAAKARYEAQEKRLRHELTVEFLDAFQRELLGTADLVERINHLSQASVVEEYKKRLTFNPSEMLFFESLFASSTPGFLSVN